MSRILSYEEEAEKIINDNNNNKNNLKKNKFQRTSLPVITAKTQPNHHITNHESSQFLFIVFYVCNKKQRTIDGATPAA